MQAKRVLARFLIFAMMGLLLEVLEGVGHHALEGNWNLRGDTSFWMIFDYGLLGVVTMYLARPMIRWKFPLAVRAFVYMIGIFIVEYVSGILFHWGMGLRVWDYSGMPYNLHGQIQIYFVVPWYLIGLSIEYLYRKVDACALVLIRGLSIEQLESA